MTLLLGTLCKSFLAPRELPRVPQPHGSTVSGAAAGRAGVVAQGGGTGWWHGVVALGGGAGWWHIVVAHCGGTVQCMPWSTEAAAEAVMPYTDPRLSLPPGF